MHQPAIAGGDNSLRFDQYGGVGGELDRDVGPTVPAVLKTIMGGSAPTGALDVAKRAIPWPLAAVGGATLWLRVGAIAAQEATILAAQKEAASLAATLAASLTQLDKQTLWAIREPLRAFLAVSERAIQGSRVPTSRELFTRSVSLSYELVVRQATPYIGPVEEAVRKLSDKLGHIVNLMSK